MNFDVDDLIAAPASAPGPASRGILRISGLAALQVTKAAFKPFDEAAWDKAKLPRRHSGTIRLEAGRTDFPAIGYCWPSNRSYTGQPLVELHLPGAPMLVETVLAELFRGGVRPARPGEFTLRAFLAGRIDLAQAEAVLGVIDAADHVELHAALRQLAGGLSEKLAVVRMDLLSLLADLEAGLDFVDEDIEFVSREDVLSRIASAQNAAGSLLADSQGRWRSSDRLRIVLAGLPNAGKSTLFNAIVGEHRALVSPLAGTTRDWLSAELRTSGIEIELIDTAGWEQSRDDLERSMQALREEQLLHADLIVWCRAADASALDQEIDELIREQIRLKCDKLVTVITKCDLLPNKDHVRGHSVLRNAECSWLEVSAMTSGCQDELMARLAAELTNDRAGGRQMIGSTAARGRESLARTHEALIRAHEAALINFGDEVIAAELRLALEGLAAVVGAVYTDDVLDIIFSRFCIGK